jgi:redox-sensitive bicupin YhaK (pirin superfamily)
MCGGIKKKFRFSIKNQSGWLNEIKVRPVLPNKFVRAIGPFVFLEHILSYEQSLNPIHKGLLGKGSNPHRGIAILTYSLAGEVEHLDSIGNHVKLASGGVHWTKAGNGIVDYEAVRSEFRGVNSDVSVVRFWINLSSKLKSEKPDYFSLQPDEIPQEQLDDNAGWVKILSGKYESTIAKVPSCSKEFIYHIHLEAGRQFSITADKEIEYAAFFPSDKAVINYIEFQAGKLVVFASLGEIIEIYNNGETAIDILLFGGEPYREKIVSDGNFVMNTAHEITQAYNDYYEGKYGRINNP